MTSSFAIPWTLAHPAPLSMDFPRQEYWSGLPCPPPGDLPDPGIQPASPALAGRFFTTEPPGKPSKILIPILKLNMSLQIMSRESKEKLFCTINNKNTFQSMMFYQRLDYLFIHQLENNTIPLLSYGEVTKEYIAKIIG